MKIKLISLLLLIALLFSNCTVVPPFGKKSGDKKSLKKVLIVSEKNRPEDPVFSKVIAALKKDGCYILLGTQKKLTNKTSKKFAAVVVVNEIKKGRKDSGIKVFLAETEQRKIILFNAEAGEYWKSTVVDGKSGDKSDNSGKIADSIIEKVRTVLKIQNK